MTDYGEEVKQWEIGVHGPADAQFLSTADRENEANVFNLKSLVRRKYLVYGKTGPFGGINLKWSNDATPDTATRSARQWIFRHDPGHLGSGDALRYGEPVALGCNKRYLRYDKRDWGINLEWAEYPVYEWVFFGQMLGRPVIPAQPIAILNLSVPRGEERGDFFIYHERASAATNIGWTSSTSSWVDALRSLSSVSDTFFEEEIPGLEKTLEYLDLTNSRPGLVESYVKEFENVG